MVAAEAMFDPKFELSDIGTSIPTALNSGTVALSVPPLTGIRIACIEAVDAVSMSQTGPVLSAVTASARPAFDPKTIVFSVNPVAFVPPLGEVVEHSAAVALPVVELAFVEIAIAVEFDTFAHFGGIRWYVIVFYIFFGVADEPLHGFGPLGGSETQPEPSIDLRQLVLDHEENVADGALVPQREGEGGRHDNQG